MDLNLEASQHASGEDLVHLLYFEAEAGLLFSAVALTTDGFSL